MGRTKILIKFIYTNPAIMIHEEHFHEHIHQEGESCSACGGRGTFTCPSCSGSGTYRCDSCGGTGTMNSADDYALSCSFCGGSGKKTCQGCNGYGTIKCARCGGSGWQD